MHWKVVSASQASLQTSILIAKKVLPLLPVMQASMSLVQPVIPVKLIKRLDQSIFVIIYQSRSDWVMGSCRSLLLMLFRLLLFWLWWYNFGLLEIQFGMLPNAIIFWIFLRKLKVPIYLKKNFTFSESCCFLKFWFLEIPFFLCFFYSKILFDNPSRL